ncbi:MAG: 6-carboxytetrahydropterin synthase [Flavobacteriia bacterium]|nr:6-carboxytetrahydropterin synthase [Flavobacteriia bacterium]
MKVCRRVSLNAAHRLYRPDWPEEKNIEVFGKCSNPNFHGHNYTIETWLDGPIDPETGYVIDLKILKEIIYREILDRFDHRNLNLDCKEFEGVIPTAENITVIFWCILREKIDPKYALTVRIWETENNIFEYSGV